MVHGPWCSDYGAVNRHSGPGTEGRNEHARSYEFRLPKFPSLGVLR